jgi:hypothetical protein
LSAKTQTISGRLAAEVRWNPEANGTIEMLKRELAEARIEEIILDAQQNFPPLTDEQISRLCDLLHGGL